VSEDYDENLDYAFGVLAERGRMVQILMSEHSHDPGLCGDVADYTNNGVYSDECLYLQRIYARMNNE